MQAIKTHNSTYARNGADYVSTVFLRKEAQVQGVNTVKVWDCSLQCYDQRLITQGGSAVENQYVWLSFLPFEDKGSNAELDNFLKYDKKPDAFGAQAWVAGRDLRRRRSTRSSRRAARTGSPAPALLDRASTASRTSTTAGSSRPTDIGGKVGSKCLIGMQVQNGKFVRVDPVEARQVRLHAAA